MLVIVSTVVGCYICLMVHSTLLRETVDCRTYNAFELNCVTRCVYSLMALSCLVLVIFIL